MLRTNKADQVNIAGIRITATNPDQAVHSMLEATKQPQGSSYHFINAYTVSLAAKNSSYKDLLNQASVVLPDGKPLAWFGAKKNSGVKQVRGPATFEAVFDHGREHGIRHYLLGSSIDTLEKLKSNLEMKYPGCIIVGTYSPPFRKLSPNELERQDEAIRESQADVVWVGLGTPKQDFEAHRIAKSTGRVAASVGAAFDFSAGTKPIAPSWMGAIGLEWLFRFLTEPKRLWKRYLVGNTVFLKTVIVNWANE